jgi:hypothetical protein
MLSIGLFLKSQRGTETHVILTIPMPVQSPESKQSSMGTCLLRGFCVCNLIALAETLRVTLRTLFLKPVVGDLRSRQIGVVTGSVMILLIAYASIDWIAAKATKELIAVGLLWLALMLSFELTVVRAFRLVRPS